MKLVTLVFAAIAGLSSQSALGSPTQATPEHDALSQCIALRTTGADRITTARWLFAVLTKSPQMIDLSAVTPQRTKELNQSFAKLMTRLITKDCVEQVRPIASSEGTKQAFEQVGEALGEIAMQELMNGKEVDKGLGDYAQYLSTDDFKPLLEGLPKEAK